MLCLLPFHLSNFQVLFINSHYRVSNCSEILCLISVCFILFLAEADEIPSPVTANSTSKNPKDRSVKLTWEEPKNPNGIVIVHEVEFSKVDNTPKQGSNSIEGISSRDANGETISNEVEKKIVVQDTVSIFISEKYGFCRGCCKMCN